MILSFQYKNKLFKFVDAKQVDYDRNIFTILVGKNGTGKSRLLSRIVTEFIQTKSFKALSKRQVLNLFDDGYHQFEEGYLNFKNPPSKVIAVSVSPFDKFPLFRFQKEIEGYSYLGIRELSPYNFGLAYMSKIIAALVSFP